MAHLCGRCLVLGHRPGHRKTQVLGNRHHGRGKLLGIEATVCVVEVQGCGGYVEDADEDFALVWGDGVQLEDFEGAAWFGDDHCGVLRRDRSG